MMKKHLLFICFLLLSPSFIFCSGTQEFFQVFEDPNTGLTVFPTLLIPLGGRYEGMGTAFTAMAIDSGFIESNPAGSAMLARNEISFHHHSWIDNSSLEGIVYASRIGNLGFGACGKFLFIPYQYFCNPRSRNVYFPLLRIFTPSGNCPKTHTGRRSRPLYHHYYYLCPPIFLPFPSCQKNSDPK